MYLYNSNEETKGLFSVRPLQIPPKTDYLKLILHVRICVYMYVCMYTCMYVCINCDTCRNVACVSTAEDENEA